jgi:hypothetical protein
MSFICFNFYLFMSTTQKSLFTASNYKVEDLQILNLKASLNINLSFSCPVLNYQMRLSTNKNNLGKIVSTLI